MPVLAGGSIGALAEGAVVRQAGWLTDVISLHLRLQREVKVPPHLTCQLEFFDKLSGCGKTLFSAEMVLYLSFPVAMFWISNQAGYFEEYVVKRKREIFPPDEKMQMKELEDFKQRMRKRREEKFLKQLGIPESQED
ncbi:PT100 protein, partial [Polypterus senegalus]|nr:PT100 protein [Polypterus senegalus]